MGAEIVGSSADQEQLQFNIRNEWYTAFLANTTQKAVQREVLHSTLEERYPDLWARVSNSRYPLAILFVGGGTGESETFFASQVEQIRGEKGLENVSLYYEDVSPQMHERFKATAQALGIFTAVKGFTMQKFEDPAYIPPDADITLGFQMWYYVQKHQEDSTDTNPLVKFAKTVQEKQGVAMLSVQSSEGDLFAIRGKRIPDLHGHPDLVAETVAEELTNLGINFHGATAEAGTNISSCFQEGKFNPTATGKNILSFILRFSWDSLTLQQQQEVARDIQDLVAKNGSQKLLFRDTYIFIPGRQSRLS